MNGYDLEYIEKLRIHELRDFARKLGVSSPTTMKKEELVGKITAIIQGDSGAIDKSSKFLKNENNFDFYQLLISDKSNILDSLLKKANNDKSSTQSDLNHNQSTPIIMKKKRTYDSDTYTTDEVVGFSFGLRQGESKYNTGDGVRVSGYVDIHPSGYGILRYDGFVPHSKDSVLTSTLLRKYNLKKGHYISGKAKEVMLDKPKIVYEINQVEDGAKVRNTKEFDELPYNGLGDGYYLEKFEFDCKRGERQYVNTLSLKDAVDLSLELVEENGVNVKLINIKARPEECYKSNQKLEIINVPFNKSEVEVVSTVQLVLERIKREMELGSANVLMIYNFSELIRIYNVACCDGVVDFEKFNSKAINKIHNILYLAKYIEKSLGCSVICIDRNGAPSDVSKIMELEFLPLFNKIHDSINRVK